MYLNNRAVTHFQSISRFQVSNETVAYLFQVGHLGQKTTKLSYLWSDMSSFTKPLAIDGDIIFPTHPSIIIKEKFSYVL